MTQEQFDRWQDFALRMARHGFETITEARKEKIVKTVQQFFSCLNERDWKEWRGWDATDGEFYLCDYFREFLQDVPGYWTFYDKPDGWEWRFESQLHSCIRAGIDVACEPSAGVVGFTVGDLRRMYPEGLPDWVLNWFEQPLTDAVSDTMGVWL